MDITFYYLNYLRRLSESMSIVVMYIFFSFLGALNLEDIVQFRMLRCCLIRVIRKSKSFHSSIFKLCIIIVHTLKICTSDFLHI